MFDKSYGVCGDCLVEMPLMEEESIDSIVTDPPYGLAFMGKNWDHGIPGTPFWVEALRVLKPGGYLLAFGGTRTFHRLACAIEDAGFEIRDCVMWVYGSGFPKSLDVSKAIDKVGGANISWFGPWLRKERESRGISAHDLAERGGFYKNINHGGLVVNWELGYGLPTSSQFNKVCEILDLPFEPIEEVERRVLGTITKARAQGSGSALPTLGASVEYKTWEITAPEHEKAKQWDGWGTALKPAWEPIIVARKPLIGTVAANVLRYGTGVINIDGCRVETAESLGRFNNAKPIENKVNDGDPKAKPLCRMQQTASLVDNSGGLGRWPANLIHDGSEDAVNLFPQSSGKGGDSSGGTALGQDSGWNAHNNRTVPIERRNDAGSAARFFYCAKASKKDRGSGNTHPTVKPQSLMRYLCKLVTRSGGIILDPFMGSGSTGVAAHLEGFDFIGIEKDENYIEIAKARITKAREDLEKGVENG
jgi:DNA modification methylase